MNDRYVIRVLDVAGMVMSPHPQAQPTGDGHVYIEAIDVDAHDGQGDAVLTDKAERALTFDSFGAALDYWRRQSTVRPLRADGLPNRPGTVFTVEVISVNDTQGEPQ